MYDGQKGTDPKNWISGHKENCFDFCSWDCLDRIFFSFIREENGQKHQRLRKQWGCVTTDAYVKKQEQRLVAALKNVEGVGKVKVMITLKSSKESVVNKDTPYEESTKKDEKAVKEDEETVLIDKNGEKVPYIVKEVEPEVEGVVVVAQGGGSDIVNQNIVDAVSVLFHISSYKIKVLKMED